MRQSPPLASLRERLDGSLARFAAIAPLLSAAMLGHVKPGGLDGAVWTLLAANSSAAAKLRQLKPRLEGALAGRGWAGAEVRIKVLRE